MLLASQDFEGGSVCHHEETQLEESEIDDLLLTVSQSYESNEQLRDRRQDKSSTLHRFGDPVTYASVEESRRLGVPPKTRGQTSWCCRVWAAWAKERNTLPEADQQEANNYLCEDITAMRILLL